MATLGYSFYEKSQYEKMIFSPERSILKSLPDFKVKKVLDRTDVNSRAFLGKLMYLHIWGTWCAPCEEEFPSFINFIERAPKDKVTFVLLAVNDKYLDIKKFIRKYDLKLPSNVLLVLDESGESLLQLGAMKVPETFIFDKNGKYVKKYVGPHDWSDPVYSEQLTQFLE